MPSQFRVSDFDQESESSALDGSARKHTGEDDNYRFGAETDLDEMEGLFDDDQFAKITGVSAFPSPSNQTPQFISSAKTPYSYCNEDHGVSRELASTKATSPHPGREPTESDLPADIASNVVKTPPQEAAGISKESGFHNPAETLPRRSSTNSLGGTVKQELAAIHVGKRGSRSSMTHDELRKALAGAVGLGHGLGSGKLLGDSNLRLSKIKDTSWDLKDDEKVSYAPIALARAYVEQVQCEVGAMQDSHAGTLNDVVQRYCSAEVAIRQHYDSVIADVKKRGSRAIQFYKGEIERERKSAESKLAEKDEMIEDLHDRIADLTSNKRAAVEEAVADYMKLLAAKEEEFDHLKAEVQTLISNRRAAIEAAVSEHARLVEQKDEEIAQRQKDMELEKQKALEEMASKSEELVVAHALERSKLQLASEQSKSEMTSQIAQLTKSMDDLNANHVEKIAELRSASVAQITKARTRDTVKLVLAMMTRDVEFRSTAEDVERLRLKVMRIQSELRISKAEEASLNQQIWKHMEEIKELKERSDQMTTSLSIERKENQELKKRHEKLIEEHQAPQEMHARQFEGAASLLPGTKHGQEAPPATAPDANVQINNQESIRAELDAALDEKKACKIKIKSWIKAFEATEGREPDNSDKAAIKDLYKTHRKWEKEAQRLSDELGKIVAIQVQEQVIVVRQDENTIGNGQKETATELLQDGTQRVSRADSLRLEAAKVQIESLQAKLQQAESKIQQVSHELYDAQKALTEAKRRAIEAGAQKQTVNLNANVSSIMSNDGSDGNEIATELRSQDIAALRKGFEDMKSANQLLQKENAKLRSSEKRNGSDNATSLVTKESSQYQSQEATPTTWVDNGGETVTSRTKLSDDMPIQNANSNTEVTLKSLSEISRYVKDVIKTGASLWKDDKRDECFQIYMDATTKVDNDLPELHHFEVLHVSLRDSLSEAHAKSGSKGAIVLRKALDSVLASIKVAKADPTVLGTQILRETEVGNFGNEFKSPLLTTETRDISKSAPDQAIKLRDMEELCESLKRNDRLMQQQIEKLRKERDDLLDAQIASNSSEMDALELVASNEKTGGKSPVSNNKNNDASATKQYMLKVKALEKKAKEDTLKLRKLELALERAEGKLSAASETDTRGQGDMNPKAVERAVALAEKRLKKVADEAEKKYEREIALLQKASAESAGVLERTSTELAACVKERDDLKRKVSELNNLSSALEMAQVRAAEADRLEKEAALNSARMTELEALYKEEQLLRKKYWNMMEDMKGKIRVYARCRPFAGYEKEKGCTQVVSFDDETTLSVDSSRGTKQFTYDGVFGPDSTQEKVFEDMKRLVQSAVDGFNVCIFAYGQTGSGKTFTMTGTSALPGVTPRTIEEIFRIRNDMGARAQVRVSCYFVELYLDNLRDLFYAMKNPNDQSPPKLDIKVDEKKIVFVKNAVVQEANSPEALMELFDKGNKMRKVGGTRMNAESSRSHSIFSIMVDVTNTTTKKTTTGKISLVDLAGSERQDKTGATDERLKEAMSINKSLSALGDVISALSGGEKFIPYRNNKLTQLMQDSLGGSAKTLMSVNISPADYNAEETVSSLTYASRVKLITNTATKNEDSEEVSRLKNIIRKLQAGEDVDAELE